MKKTLQSPGRSITDLSDISPQRTFLESYPAKPDATSSLYVTKNYTHNADGSENHFIAGVHIVLKQGHENQLWEMLTDKRKKQDANNPQVKVKSLELICDTLEIHGEFRIPETNITLYARQLVWANDKSAINSSPLPWAVDRAQNASAGKKGADGADGRHAGALSLYVNYQVPSVSGTQRLIAHGGDGQHPGLGVDGKNGNSYEGRSEFSSSINIALVVTKVPNKAHVKFDVPAIYYKYFWSWIGIKGTTGDTTWGSKDFPTSGTDALAPGKPGNAGNGGTIKTNNDSLLKSSVNKGGVAGKKDRNYKGGKAGTPTKSAKYEVNIHMDATGTENAGHKITKTAGPHTTKDGKGASAKAADILKGKSEHKLLEGEALWLHPLQLQKMLGYARDLHLSGEVKEVEALLNEYEKALSAPMPNNKIWDGRAAIHWARASNEISVIFLRVRNHLDYFGNAAGFTPFLSLQGTVKLFEQEAKRALHLLLLVNWINTKERSVKELSDMLSEGIKKRNEDITTASDQVVKAELEIIKYRSLLDNIEAKLRELSKDLSTLENELTDKAHNDLAIKAMIKGGIKMAAALCQVIPIGQPVLGTVGSLADVATDLMDSDNKVPDTVSRIGDVFDKAHGAAKKAEEARMKLKDFRSKHDDEEVPSAGKQMMGKVSSGIGPALSQASKALSAMQVSASEVEAELQRLESESEEWKELTDKIRSVNERKAEALNKLLKAVKAVNEGYAQIGTATIAIMDFQEQKTKALDKLDPEAIASVNEMDQEARHTLIYYLYLMVKAYETTVLKPIDINWKLSEISQKIQHLLKDAKDFQASDLRNYIEILWPVYSNNIDKIRNQLVDGFQFNERSNALQIGLDSEQTPRPIQQINNRGETLLDPMLFGLLLSDQHLARISDVNLLKVEFDPEGPQLPDNANMIISLQPQTDGTLRKSEKLYAVYSDQPISWRWTYIPSAKEGERIKKSEMSSSAQDMLDFILGDKAGDIKQKMAYPPVWSGLRLKVDYTPLPSDEMRPRISKLYLLFDCDSSSAPDGQCVLKVHQTGVPAAIKVDCTKDLAARANGLNNFYRIFSKNSAVELSVPEVRDGATFEQWKLVGRRKVEAANQKSKVKFSIDGHVTAQSLWKRRQQLVLKRQAPMRMAKRKVMSKAPDDLIIRLQPEDTTAVLGLVPNLNEAIILEEGKNNWKQVNYEGIIGWVKA